MTSRLDNLAELLKTALGDKLTGVKQYVGELTLDISGEDIISCCKTLRDHEGCRFEQLIDLCGVDYSEYKESGWEGSRYAVVYHLLSVSLNQRIRVRAFVRDDSFPMIASCESVWPVANWFEREAFDLFGIMFDGHPDLRRLLTDYGFIGHPFRKDFPMIGNVEMRYDAEQQRVIYQPVSIELRNNVPRIIRDEGFHRG